MLEIIEKSTRQRAKPMIRQVIRKQQHFYGLMENSQNLPNIHPN